LDRWGKEVPKGKNHYVPQLYLRHFSSKPRKIHVHHIRSGRFIFHAGLRDQCQRHKFYGRDGKVEDKLADFEGEIAPVLNRIIDSQTLPEQSSREYLYVLSFLALQLVRTPSAIDDFSEGAEKMLQLAFRGSPDASERVAALRPSKEETLQFHLGMAIELSKVLSDLGSVIVSVRGPTPLIASDNPAVKYNLYCEGVQGVGVTGLVSSGFLLFLPLSPKCMLLLYDKHVYKTRSARDRVVEAGDPSDVFQLNMLQALYADNVVLFSEETSAAMVSELFRKVRGARSIAQPRADEFVADDDPDHHSLLALHAPMPNLKLRLSFLTVRRKARRVALFDRARGYRRTAYIPSHDYPPPPPDSPAGRIFRRAKKGEV